MMQIGDIVIIINYVDHNLHCGKVGVHAFITGGYLSEGRKGEILDKDSNDKSL